MITVDKASGRVQATTVNEGIRITNSTGEITAETTNGNIFIDNAQTSNLEAFTVNGDVTFNGTIRDNGVYKLTTHSGDIRVGLGGANNATIFVRTFQGDFTADFPVQLPEGQNPRSGSKRFNFTLGSGSARIELQSFSGDIVLARKAITSREEERRRRREGVAPPAQPPQPPQPPQARPRRRRSRRSRQGWIDAELGRALRRRRSPPSSRRISSRTSKRISRRASRSTSRRTSRRALRRPSKKNFEKNFREFERIREGVRRRAQGLEDVLEQPDAEGEDSVTPVRQACRSRRHA